MFPELSACDVYKISTWFKLHNVETHEELLKKLEQIHNQFHPVKGDTVRFTLEELEEVDDNENIDSWIVGELLEYYYSIESEKFIKKLRENPPSIRYENPYIFRRSYFRNCQCLDRDFNEVCQCPEFERRLMNLIQEIDLPGSKFNPAGNGSYYSELFYHMFFGNYSDFNDHIMKLSKPELEKTLRAREGYPQFSPVFAPIIGRRMLFVDELPWRLLTDTNIKDIRMIWNGENENAHFMILEKLLQLGADVNAHDLSGNTALDYACLYPGGEGAISILLKYGADPNLKFQYRSTLYQSINSLADISHWRALNLLLDGGAKPRNYEEASEMRYFAEEGGYVPYLVAKVRELCPRKKDVCERTDCNDEAVKKCGACKSVVYCSPGCQKNDWKFHKPTCKTKTFEKKWIDAMSQLYGAEKHVKTKNKTCFCSNLKNSFSPCK